MPPVPEIPIPSRPLPAASSTLTASAPAFAEIEPFGGAATCLGGAIRDPLSGRSYVYQAMRVTGADDPRQPFSDTLPGKLPQRA